MVDTKCVMVYSRRREATQRGNNYQKRGAEVKMTIGEKLKKLRGEKSQEEVARAVFISNSALSSYENGDRIPRDDVKRRLASYYDKTVGEIFFNEK